jgi:hypothetical protein
MRGGRFSGSGRPDSFHKKLLETTSWLAGGHAWSSDLPADRERDEPVPPDRGNSMIKLISAALLVVAAAYSASANAQAQTGPSPRSRAAAS